MEEVTYFPAAFRLRIRRRLSACRLGLARFLRLFLVRLPDLAAISLSPEVGERFFHKVASND